MKNLAAIILAGGEGTRFNRGRPSLKPKVLYKVNGKPLIFYSLDLLKKIGISEVVIVVGYKGEDIRKVLGEKYKYALQENPLGTGDAVSKGLEKVSSEKKNVIVLYGADIYSEETIMRVIHKQINNKPIITFVTVKLESPAGFGRIVRDKIGNIKAVVEEKVATKEQKEINEVNDGCYIFNKDWLKRNISNLELSKAKEYFLTDLVEVAINENSKVETYTIDKSSDWIGVDSFDDIKIAEEKLKGSK